MSALLRTPHFSYNPAHDARNTSFAVTGFPAATSLVPGTFVRHPDEPDWGLGQVQSVIGNRVTVNFENRGKLLVNANTVALVAVDIDRGAGGEL